MRDWVLYGLIFIFLFIILLFWAMVSWVVIVNLF